MIHALFTHEFADGRFWYDEETCINDFEENLDYELIFDTFGSFTEYTEIVRHGLNGDTNWFHEIYEQAIDCLINNYVYCKGFTDEEIEILSIMDEKIS